jgi:branched-chain amino acid transport system substrate-binding protein
MKVRQALFATACGLAMLAAAGTARAQIRIAVVGPMTGQYAAFGVQYREGAEQAVADINAKGGLLGQKVVLKVGDDACDPRQAVSVANQLASDGVKFVAGHYCSGSSIPASKVYADEGVLEITPSSTNPAYTDKGSWNTFRVCGRDDQQGKVAGEYIAKNMKDKKIAILTDNTAYGKGLADEMKKALNANGVTEAMYAAYTPGERDYSALVSRMKQMDIGVLYLGGYFTEGGLIVRQAKEQGLNLTMIGGDALMTSEFWQITGDTGDGTLMTFPPDPRKDPAASSVVQEFKAKNIDPEGYVLYAYAAVQIWAEAVAKAGTADPKKVADLLHQGTPWDSVLGPISFDHKGDVTKANYVFYAWHKGGYGEM